MLGKVDFLRVLSDTQRDQLAAASKLHVYGAGEVIVRQGESTAQMFIIQTGSVVVEHDRVDVATLGPGELFGEMALMTGEQRTATVRAATPSTLVSIDRDAMRALLAVSPELASLVSRVIAERKDATSSSQPVAAAPAQLDERSTQLLGRIRKFFQL